MATTLETIPEKQLHADAGTSSDDLYSTQKEANSNSGKGLMRFLPIVVIIAVLVGVFATGLHRQLSLEALRENIGWLDAQVAQNFLAVFFGYILLYAAATAFMVPGGILTIAGGVLFGVTFGLPLMSTLATVVGATLGASILFLAAKTSLGGPLRKIAGPFLERMESEFNRSPVSYMFVLRLVPAVPFAVANIAPALLGAKYREYLLTTFFGIIPGTMAYSWVGAGAAEFIRDPSVSLNDTNALIASLGAKVAPALIALFVVALIPVVYRRFFQKSA